MQNNFLVHLITKSSTNPKGTPEPEPEDHYSHLGSPATGSRTQEPFRFPGLTPQPPIYIIHVSQHNHFHESLMEYIG